MARGEDTSKHPARLVGRQRMTSERAIQVLGYGGEGATDIRNSFSSASNPDALENQLYRSFWKRKGHMY